MDNASRRLPWLQNCLVQSLTFWWLAGPSRKILVVRFGAQQGADGFAAHAWVEFEGEVILGHHDGAFVPFDGDRLGGRGL